MNTFKVVVTAIVFLFIGRNLSAQSIEYVESTYWTGVNDIEIVGTYAFCGYGEGFEVYDISNPISLIMVDHIRLGYVGNVHISGDYAYITSFDTGLNIIDISDPSDLALVGNYPNLYRAVGASVQGSYAYICCSSDSGLFVFDISDLSNPVLVGNCPAPGYARSIFTDGNYAYTANESFGVNIFDISNPLDPFQIGGIITPERAFDIEVVNGNAFIADDDSGLQIYNVSNPLNPIFIGSCDTPDMALGVMISGQYAYVSDCESGIQIINIHSLSQPHIIGSYDTPFYASQSSLSGNTLWIADYSSIEIVNVSNPQDPTYIGSYSSQHSIRDTYIDNNLAYIAHDKGFQIINVSDPYSPSRIGYYENSLAGTPREIYIYGNHAYMTVSLSGLAIVDISSPQNPVLTAQYLGNSDYYDAVYVSGQYAYVGGEGLTVLDISNPYNPVQVGYFFANEYFINIIISGDYAYTLGWNFRIFDISDPSNPQELSVYGFEEGPPLGLLVQDNYAFITSYDIYPDTGTLEIVDISIPTMPSFVGRCGISDHAYDVAVSGNYAIVAAWGDGLKLLDISNPTNPFYISGFDTYGYADNVIVSGDYIYLSDNNAVLILQLVTTGIFGDDNSLPLISHIFQNYPNPFNSSTTIEFGLPEAEYIRIDIYDLLGRRIEMLVDEEVQGGRHQVVWDALDYSSGVYFYRIEAGDYTETKKMVLLR
jgi:hypothetical protein